MLGMAGAVMAGDLNPPPGPVMPTMTRLDRLEPRRCLNDLPGSADAVHVISSPGQYYLSSDIVGQPGKHGIHVLSGGSVSIDLNGFSLHGVPGSFDAINADGAGQGDGTKISTAQDHNSSRSNKTASVISNWDGSGFSCTNYESAEVSGLNIENCAGYGTFVAGTTRIVHRDVSVRSCALGGIRAGKASPTAFGLVTRSFERCVVDTCGGNGLQIDVSFENDDVSVSSSSVSGCPGHGLCIFTVVGSGSLGLSSGKVSLEGISSSGNGQDGIHIAYPPNIHVRCSSSHLRCVSNGGSGMACVSSNPAIPYYGAMWTITDSEFSNNGEHGLKSQNPLYVSSSTCADNPLHGINLSVPDAFQMAATMEHCVTTRNGLAGVHVSRGRYAPSFCQFTDETGIGVEMLEGCLVMSNCSVHRCGGDGIDITGTINLHDSTFRRNGGYGIRGTMGAMTLTNAVCEYNGSSGGGGGGGGALFTDCTSVTLSSCVFGENTGNGVTCSSSIGPIRWMSPECISHRNSGNGFDLSNCAGGQLIRCRTSGNGGRGIQCSSSFTGGVIEGCTSTGDQGGIHVLGTGNLIRSNTATISPNGGFSIAQGNAAGTVIDQAGLASRCSPHDNVLH